MNRINLDTVLLHSPDIVARDIEGEIIIIPIASGIGDIENELYSLNDTGRYIWEKIDGKNTVLDIISQLKIIYEDPSEQITTDVIGITEELLERKLVEIK